MRPRALNCPWDSAVTRDEVVAKLRYWVGIKEFSAQFLSGNKTVDLLPEQVREKMLASDLAELLNRDLGDEQLSVAVFLSEMADLVEAEKAATGEQLERLDKIAAEHDRYAEQEQSDLDDYNAYHEDDDEEPDADRSEERRVGKECRARR